MDKTAACMICYFIIAFAFGYNEFKKTMKFYDFCISITENNFLHFLHTTLVFFVLFMISKYMVKVFIGQLRQDEITSIYENSFSFFTDMVLVLSIFSEDISTKNAIIFIFLVLLKCGNWIIIERVKYQHDYNILFLVLIIGSISLTVSISSFFSALVVPSVFILFSFEFGIVALSSLRNLIAIGIHKSYEGEKKTIAFFINDISFLFCRIIAITTFFVFTTTHYKLPFNLLRDAISTLRLFLKKIYDLFAYIKLCKKLESFENSKDAGECSVCCCEMEIGKKIQCGHVFHKECLRTWAERSQVCPICRQSFFKNSNVTFNIGNETITGTPITPLDY